MPDIEKLIKDYSNLTGLAKDAERFHDEAIHFLNRKLYPDYMLNSKPADPYSLKAIESPKVLDVIWYDSPDEPLESQSKLIFATLEESLNLAEKSTKVVAGRGLGAGDDALYAAWQIVPDVRENIYLVVMHSARYHDRNVWLLEGDLNALLSPDSVGRLPRSGDEKEAKTWSHIITPIDEDISFEDFGNAYRKALESEIIKSES